MFGNVLERSESPGWSLPPDPIPKIPGFPHWREPRLVVYPSLFGSRVGRHFFMNSGVAAIRPPTDARPSSLSAGMIVMPFF